MAFQQGAVAGVPGVPNLGSRLAIYVNRQDIRSRMEYMMLP